jgi:hypothetical protein
MMVKDGLKISILAGMFVIYPAFAEDVMPPDPSKNSGLQEQAMDQPAPSGNYQPDTSDGDDHRAEIADFKDPDQNPVHQQEEQLPPTATATPAPSQTQAADNQHVDNSNTKTTLEKGLPQQQQLASNQNQEAPHPDFQATPSKIDEEQHGHELTESEENVYESDQQQYEQAQSSMDPDKKNSELSDRITQEQSKLQNDSAKNDSVAVEEDKQSLVLDKQELEKQEIVASNHGQSLDEFNSQDNSEAMTAENTQAALPSTPEPASQGAKNPELAMNTQTPRVPW